MYFCYLAFTDDLGRHVVGGAEHVVQALGAVVHLARACMKKDVPMMQQIPVHSSPLFDLNGKERGNGWVHKGVVGLWAGAMTGHET